MQNNQIIGSDWLKQILLVFPPKIVSGLTTKKKKKKIKIYRHILYTHSLIWAIAMKFSDYEN